MLTFHIHTNTLVFREVQANFAKIWDIYVKTDTLIGIHHSFGSQASMILDGFSIGRYLYQFILSFGN